MATERQHDGTIPDRMEGADVLSRKDRAGDTIDAQRLGVSGRIRKLFLNIAIRILKKASQMSAHSGDREMGDREILDRIDEVLSHFPRWLRDLLLGSKGASEFFPLLEGKDAGDAAGIAQSVEAIRRREEVRISTQRHGRNAPCPCGSGQKFKKCCGKKAQS
ncbi:MAG: SEC-C metal-binding domain-containing protein [Candidatus Peribacteraceae bacterium]|nr:SEC-C metal-binding domain-containing protein [Candidatus Peribacteraceae bacterium]MDD5742274.1 SEC-C metal-binding domain-containing protein [Candidatus Peribacteraceae bacterium]